MLNTFSFFRKRFSYAELFVRQIISLLKGRHIFVDGEVIESPSYDATPDCDIYLNINVRTKLHDHKKRVS